MQITPTPIIYVEDIRLNDLSINGAVFSISEDGVYTPEVGAFVYVYVNDILFNEQADPYSLIRTASRTGYVTTTTIDGTWVCPVSSLRAGQRLTAVAHAVGKNISEPSSPYRVGSLPMPVDIHEVNQFGQNDTLKHGHSVIEGYFEGLHNRKYSRYTDFEGDAYAFPYTSNFNLCPYIDGIKQTCLPYNEIWSKNFLGETVDIDWDDCFTILVQSVPINICLTNIVNNIYNETFGYYDLEGTDTLRIHPPQDAGSVIIHVYRNGLRLVEGTDNDYIIELSGGYPILVFNSAFFSPLPDDIYMCDYLVTDSEYFPYYRTTVIEYSTAASFGVNRGVGLQVFKNGVRLKENSDFTLSGGTADKFVLLSESLLPDDVFVMSYFDVPTTSTPYRIDTTTNFSTRVEVSQDGTSSASFIRVFKDALPALPQMIMLYKNGLRLAFGANFDYTKSASNLSYTEYRLVDQNQFSYVMSPDLNGILVPVVQDNVVVELMYSGISVKKVEEALNNLPAFIENKLVARVMPPEDPTFLQLSSPYTIEFIEGDTSYYKTFGKGPSLVPGKDENGNFKNFIDFKNNTWRYTFSKPLKRLQSVTAATFLRT